jgi:hypothetical protein
MLLEQLVEKAGQPPAYDWDAYYRWLFSELAGREVAGYSFWQCKQCLTVNVVYLPRPLYGNADLIRGSGSTSAMEVSRRATSTAGRYEAGAPSSSPTRMRVHARPS